jgi:hypothetical protein
MRVREARFHPLPKTGGAAAPVARVLCDHERTIVEPIDPQLRGLRPFDPDALMKKLTFLVDSAQPRPYEQLTSLRSQFWSFAEVPAGEAGGQ